MGNLWWGYQHQSGTLHTKRFFSELDISEAEESPFVKCVFGPWDCKDKEEAETKLKECLNIK